MRDDMIDTRVTLDGIVGPYDCKQAGRRSFCFDLDATRQVSAGTLQMAEEYGFSCMETIHVIDGRQGAPDTVHVFDSGETYVVNEWGDRAPRAVAVRVRWRGQTPTATIGAATREARRAARKTAKHAGGRGAPRAVVVLISWQWIDGEDTGTEVIDPVDGLYPIGAWEWPWSVVEWTCGCGHTQAWHEPVCLCGATREERPKTPLATAAILAGQTLRRLVPESASAVVDVSLARIIAVHDAEGVEIETADDAGHFDTETLGEADGILSRALNEDADLTAAGWEHVPDAQSKTLYRISFPASRTH